MSAGHEEALAFLSADLWLPAVLHHPAAEAAPRVGVVVVVGGPQYRVGSHRQFVLLARDLAAAGYPVLRFDYRGMGDAEGEPVGFEGAGPDIGAAVEQLMQSQPALEGVVLWGLCDAASAALFRAPQDDRVLGLVLLNPWVRTESGAAQATLQHYYGRRLTDPRAWLRLLREPRRIVTALRSLVTLRAAAGRRPALEDRPLPARMLTAAQAFRGRMLWILSGNDLTADEFRDLLAAEPRWQRMLEDNRSRRVDLPRANHTFSSRAWREEVSQATRRWLDAHWGRPC